MRKLLAQADVMEAGWSLGGHNENEGKVAAERTAQKDKGPAAKKAKQ